MDDLFWFLLCLILGLPLLIFGLHYIIIGNKLNNKKLTGSTNGYLASYERQKNAYTGGKQGRLVPYKTSAKYTYTVDGKKFALNYSVFSGSATHLPHTDKIVYLKSSPKYAYCDTTKYYHIALGWVLLILGFLYYGVLLLFFIN